MKRMLIVCSELTETFTVNVKAEPQVVYLLSKMNTEHKIFD